MKLTLVNKLLTTAYLTLISLGVVTSTPSVATEIDDFQGSLVSIDKAHQNFTNNFYRQLIKTPAIKDSKYHTIEALLEAVQDENKLNNQVKSVALILNNQVLLTRYYDSLETITLLQQLLANNALISTQKIMNNITEQGDDTVNQQLNYLLAEFYFQRQDWPTVLTYLDENTSDLPIIQYQHALLMQGVALQRLGEHGFAINVYEKIPPSALDYTAAQINMALANIRQGWWTDGHRILRQLLTEQQTARQELTLNRLTITLGYSLLNQAYYRNARETFQLISVDSRYSNQALLGIALTAAHQKDYIGALNATRYLKEKQQDDLPIDEAFLLMPFFYEESQQLDTASLGYSQAANYYQQKILTINALINSPIDLKRYPVTQNNVVTLDINKTHLDFSANYPDYFFSQRRNIKQLTSWLKPLASAKLTDSFTVISQHYDKLTIKMAKSIMKNRVTQLNSYLNQSRYGLARLYDNNTAEQ